MRRSRDVLTLRHDAAVKRCSELAAAIARRHHGLRCLPTRHEWVRVNVIAGGCSRASIGLAIGRDVSVKGIWGGYQIHRCLTCPAWGLFDYAGKHRTIIAEAQAKRLL
jgi:hypothetical protein